MNNTTYNEIYRSFMVNYKVNPSDLPQTDGKRYLAIQNAVQYYNNKMRTNIKCDDEKEEISTLLNNDELLILVNILKLTFLENEQTYFTSVWSVFAKELGLKNYKDQVNSKRNLVRQQKSKIEELILNTIDTWEI